MCKLMEDMRNEAAHEAAHKAERESARKTAKRFLKMGKLSHEEIADGTGLPLEEVKALEEEIMHLYVATEMECRRATMCKMLEDMRNETERESEENSKAFLENGQVISRRDF